MSKDLNQINLKALPGELARASQKLSRYRVVLFVVFVASVYGFISFKIFTLSSQSTATSDVQTQVTNLTPHIDIDVVDQLENLKDNSVNVKTLFQASRDNPFAE
ncbi:hypothetical protein BH09PAT4_BH09PAT4_02100 [soil metagenome]